MADYLFKPTANGAGLFTNTLAFDGLDPAESVAVADGTYDIFQKVHSGLVVAQSSAFDAAATLGTDMFFWWDMTDPNNMFQNTDWTSAVTADGQTVGSINDKGGQEANKRAFLSGSGATWNAANERVDFDGTNNVWIELETDTGLDSGGYFDLIISWSSSDDDTVVMSSTGGVNRYAGFIVSGGASAPDSSWEENNAGITYWEDSPASQISSPTNGDLFTQYQTGSGKLVILRDLDLRKIAQTTGELQFLTNQARTRPFNGSIKHIILAHSLTTTKLNTLLAEMATTEL